MQNVQDLLKIADTLLGPNGCSWDKKQTLLSLQKYLLEEAHEVLEAIDEKDFSKIKEELGDLIYTIVFIAKLSEREKQFTFDEAVDALCQKLIRRHPHVFQEKRELTADQVLDEWHQMKKQEKKRKTVFEGIPETLPLLPKMQLIMKRLKKTNPDVLELEIKESGVKSQGQKNRAQTKEEEIAKKLFALVLDAEDADISLEDLLRRKLKKLKNRLDEQAV